MDLLHHIVVKWGLALLYIATCLLLVLLFPPLIRPWLLLLFLVFLAWTFWNYEDQAGWEMDLRPLTPWDVADWAQFRIRVSEACREAGLSREPYLAVMESPFPNAMAIGGRRGMIVYTTAALRALGQEELLAVTGHELAHLAAGDAWPTMVGGAWLRLIGWLCGLLYNFGSRGGGLLFLAARAGAVGLDVALRGVSWLAGISFAQRSRHQEYAADLLGARVTSSSAMCGALLRLEELRVRFWASRRSTVPGRRPGLAGGSRLATRIPRRGLHAWKRLRLGEVRSMPVKYRLLALLLYGIHILAPLRWLAGLSLTVLGVYTVSRAGLSAALPWWAGAVLVVAPSLVTALRGYTVFVPTGEPVTEVLPGAPAPTYALATGPLRTRTGFRWLPLHRVEAEPVQVRWLAGSKPPALAVLCPPDMPLTLSDPLAEADAAGLFYPGMEVRLGTVAVGAKLYAGLQATFPGKRLVLAFTEPRAADAYGGALKLFRVI